MPAVLLLTGVTVPADAHRQVRVPGAEHRQLAYLDDLTTAGTMGSGHTNPADYAGLTHAALSAPSGVPGIQNHPELYTRGVDLDGTLWTVNGPNLHVPATGNQGL